MARIMSSQLCYCKSKWNDVSEISTVFIRQIISVPLNQVSDIHADQL